MTRDRRRNQRRRSEVTIDSLLAADDGLRRHHDLWTGQGYRFTSGRLWRCKNGSWTGRFVWRNRAEVVSSVTYTVQGLVL